MLGRRLWWESQRAKSITKRPRPETGNESVSARAASAAQAAEYGANVQFT